MEMYEQWPLLEFSGIKSSILSKFSIDAGTSVAHLLVKELADNIDRPTSSRIATEQDLEWIMQIINHAFSLPFSSKDYETIRGAVRIYLTWTSALTVDIHPSCPIPLQDHPDRYFRRMLDAMRQVFIPREAIDAESGHRQSTEIRSILSTLQGLSEHIVDEFKDEAWSKLILFLLEINSQMLDDPKVFDDFHSPVASKLIGTLLNCWITASLQEYIPSPAYWKTFTLLSRKWVFHVPLIEHWGRKVLALGSILMQKTYGSIHWGPTVTDEKLIRLIPLRSETKVPKELSETWFRTFHLLGSPSKILESELSGNSEHLSLSFFLAVLVNVRLIDIIYGDSEVSMTFQESGEVHQMWQEACRELQEEWSKSYHQHRLSNLSNSSIPHSASMDNTPSASAASSTASGSVGRKNALIIPGSRQMMRASTRTHPFSSVQKEPASAPVIIDEPPIPIFHEPARPTIGQFVFHYLKTNQFRHLKRHSFPKHGISSNALLDVFLYFLGDAAQASPLPQNRHPQQHQHQQGHEDAISQKSMSSCDFFENIPSQHAAVPQTAPVISSSSTSAGINNNAEKGGVTRRSFAQSTASSSDYSLLHSAINSTTSSHHHQHHQQLQQQQHPSPSSCDFPLMDGIAAGRAAALGALCRIVCEKTSFEELSADQLAQFYLIIHKALVERDRLTLCSILYYGNELFKLGLKGVEILLPNYLMAIDIILTESMKLRLHPSIQEIEMRHTCLQALSSIVSWPTTFGASAIIDESIGSKLGQGNNNLLDQRPTYLDLRQRILRTLVHTLRNEGDPTNLHLALSSCAVFCHESSRHDLDVHSARKASTAITASSAATSTTSEGFDSEEDKCFAVSALRAVISAICDNIYKSQWTTELTIPLSALDCLNSLAALPNMILFSNDEMSTGSLIITSLCRFIDVQLRKPPMYHSRDLHSSVVAAYSSLGVWFTAAPKLTEIESCLATVAEAIEFGITGGKNLMPEEYKPASLRVRDAADNLLNVLLSNVSKDSEIVDERRLLYKYGPQSINTTKFKHFLINQNTLLSIHEAFHIEELSKGLPSLFVVTRTPYSLASTSFYQLKPSTIDDADNHGVAVNVLSTENSPASVSVELPADNGKQTLRRIGAPSTEHRLSIDSTLASEGIKQFEFPAGFDKPLCKLDSASPEIKITPEANSIVAQLQQIQNRLSAGGGSASGNRDSQNVWIQSSLGALLTQQLKPQNPSCKVNSVRNFLYDLGFINDKSFGTLLQPLDSGNSEEFYRDLHQIVDRTHTRIAQTVGIFFVKEGQKNMIDILENSLFLDETSPEFCNFLSELGECVDVSKHPHWTGHFATAFSSERKPIEVQADDRYAFDGISHCLWWSDSLLEIAYVLYSERSYRINNLLPGGEMKEPKVSVCTKPREASVVDSAFEDDTSMSTGSLTPTTTITTSATLKPHSLHQFQRQKSIKKSKYPVIQATPESNNNNICEKPCLSASCQQHFSHSPQVRRCLSVSTSVTVVPSIDSSSESPTPPSSRLYTRHHHPIPTRQFSLSPNLGKNTHNNNLNNINNNNFLEDDTFSSTDIVEVANFDECEISSSAPKSPSATSYSYLKSFFRRGKTPEPESSTSDALASVRLITDAISMPHHNSQHSRPLRSTSPSSEPQNSRRSDVSQNSLHSNSTSSNYTSTSKTPSNRTKSSSTINSEAGSAATHKISTAPHGSDKSPKRCIDQRVFVVWLERLEDMYHFPLEQLFEITEDGSRYSSPKPDHVVIFLHPAEPGLIRIHIEGIWTKYGQPGPLADGAVVSSNSLPQLLRETICSIARRKSIEVETFQASSSRRRQAIQEFARKYSMNQNYEEFLDAFISSS